MTEFQNFEIVQVDDLVIVPKTVIKSYHYVYKGLYTWSLPPIIHAKDVDAIGFSLTNTTESPISGISVGMIIAWDDFIDEGYLVMPAGAITLSVPLDQYWNVIRQPFIAVVGDTKVWFGFEPPYDLRWGGGSGPPMYTITAKVYKDGKITARTIVCSVSYT